MAYRDYIWHLYGKWDDPGCKPPFKAERYKPYVAPAPDNDADTPEDPQALLLQIAVEPSTAENVTGKKNKKREYKPVAFDSRKFDEVKEMRTLTREQNKEKRENAPPGMKWCSEGQHYVKIDDWGGHPSYCRPCASRYMRERNKR